MQLEVQPNQSFAFFGLTERKDLRPLLASPFVRTTPTCAILCSKLEAVAFGILHRFLRPLVESPARRGADVGNSVQAKRFFVAGLVQGVGFRFFAQRVAARLGMAGYVKNLRDGRVEVYAIGSPAQMDALRSELRRGPRAASVSEVGEQDAEVEPQQESGFSIKHEW